MVLTCMAVFVCACTQTLPLTASKKYDENLTASRVAEVTINLRSGLLFTA